MDPERFRHYTDWHALVARRRYDAPADPWTLLEVDPTAIEYYTSEVPIGWGLGRVEGGAWDRPENRREVADAPTYAGLVQRFEEGRDWEETALWERAERQLEETGSFRRYESLSEFESVRCAYLDDLFARIEREGYRPNREAGHDNPAAEDNPYEDAYAHHLEPIVAVARDGEILWCEGYHRLAIAAILDLESIPVYVCCRHEKWQRIRDRVVDASDWGMPDELDEYAGHPDLEDVARDR